MRPEEMRARLERAMNCGICNTPTAKHAMHCSAVGGPLDRLVVTLSEIGAKITVREPFHGPAGVHAVAWNASHDAAPLTPWHTEDATDA